ncbi:MAG: hypothetical protein R2932_43715 [Caldilineaceae bacterium]
MMRIRRIRIWSAVKMTGFLYAIIGLITALFSTSMIPVWVAAMPQLPTELFGQPIASMLTIGAIVLLPILYWFLGSIVGILVALIYNLAAGWFGGLEIEYE